MISPQQATVLPLRLGKLELREALSSSFFGARLRARLADTGRSGTHALGTGAQLSALPASGSELCSVRIVCAEDPDVLDRLAHAATVARGAQHPALLAPLQLVRARGRLAIVARDVAGTSLAQLVERAGRRDEGLPQAIVLRIVLDVLAGLHALEAAVHAAAGDPSVYGGLTPDSIHVGRDGHTRVLDPGVMSAAARERPWAGERRMLAYSAPELHAGSARFDAGLDTFAIGIVLWELLSCRSLFLAPSARETIHAVCRAPIARVRRERFVRGEPIAAAVAKIVARALSREPAQRFRSYEELAAALREAAPAAEAEQVAAFVALMDEPDAEHAFDDSERVTAKVSRLELGDVSIDVELDAAEPIAARTALEPATVEPAASTPASSASNTASAPQPRRAAWTIAALGVLLLVALAALASRSPEATSPDHAQAPAPEPRVAPPAAPAARALEPTPKPTPSVPATPAPLAQPSAEPTPIEPRPEASAPAKTATPRAAPARRSPRKKPAKRPFIPDDI